MNKLTYAALVGAISAKQQPSQVDIVKMEQIVDGLLKGALHAEGFDDIAHCIQDVEEVVADAETAVADFKAGDIQHVIDGVKEVGELIKVVKQGMQDCSHIKADWDRLAKMVAIFNSPTSFAYHVGKDLLVNGVEIYDDVTSAVNAYENQRWGDFGYAMGEAAAKALLGSEELGLVESMDDKKMKEAQILQGITNAFGGHFSLWAFFTCVRDEDQAAMAFVSAAELLIQAYAEKNFGDVVGATLFIISGVKFVESGLPACEDIWHSDTFNSKPMFQALKIFENPSKHIKVIEDDITINGHAIWATVGKAVEAYQAGDYVGFGE
jgi:hypothetical protein